MWTLRAIVLLAGMSLSAASAAEFTIQDVGAIAKEPVEKLKPNTIVFSDQPAEDLLDASTGFIKFEDWARARPLQKKLLALHPSYVEPNVELTIGGVKRRYREKFHMYVGEARFLLARPPERFDLAALVALPFVEKADPAIRHRLVKAAELKPPEELRIVYNRHPTRSWCEGRSTPTICIASHYQLEGRLPAGIQLLNKIRESRRKIAEYLDFESELTLLTPAEVEETGLKDLAAPLDTPPIGALEQSIFYVNQVMQFGKLVALFQPHPADAGKIVASVFIALGIESSILTKRKEFGQVPVLRNLVPAQVLLGKSSFNTGNSLSAGLPVYARNRIRAIAALLDGG
jgi:hypothetical protein